MGWNSTKDKLPPDMIDVLGYTDADKFKVVSIKNGVWNTYMNVLYWMWLPDKPDIKSEEPTKRRGRKKATDKT